MEQPVNAPDFTLQDYTIPSSPVNIVEDLAFKCSEDFKK
jgi:hypothetical protein